ncbi:MAG: serine--tRNA ligase, partial [Clostridiales bacterium]|nr:serine--tRNA ligase [Clostridiales bacterium]
MLDIKLIRENPQKVKDAMRSRNKNMDALVDEVLSLDLKRRELIAQTEALKQQQNAANKEIPRIKKEGGDISQIMVRMNELKESIKNNDAALSEIEAKQSSIMYEFPNIPHSSVPVGKDDSENIEIRRWGEPRKFDFQAKAHWDIGADMGILDPETAAKVTGARFHFYRGMGAKLERAIINFFLNTHSENGYLEVFPPYMVNRASMTGTGQLPKFEEDAFKTNNDYFLIPTAEVPVTNMHRDEILDGKKLPIKYCAYSACFRAEAGSAGRDTRGLIRQHQFNKVELVKFANPENSYDELESLTRDAERVLQLLGLPHRVV